MVNTLRAKLQYFIPKQLITCLVGWLANRPLPLVTQWAIKIFVSWYKINLKEAAKLNPEDYQTFNDFFSRSLGIGSRPIAQQSDALVFPADGIIEQFGNIEKDQLLHAKGDYYSLEALLAGQYLLAEQFSQGSYIIVYISPRDYHRVHMPCDGTLREMLYVPGALFSVNPAVSVPNVFARNERVICVFDTPFGSMIQILIGATIVGSIETSWDHAINQSRSGIIKRTVYSEDQRPIFEKGDEMGKFKLGSTVITLFSNQINFNENLRHGHYSKMGQAFAKN